MARWGLLCAGLPVHRPSDKVPSKIALRCQSVKTSSFSPCEVLTLEINHEKYLKLLELVSEFNRNPLKYKYNFLGLICLYFKIPHKLHRHFTCTEFVAWLLGNIDISPNVDKDVSLIVPNDYYKIPSVKSVYRGRIQSFCLA